MLAAEAEHPRGMRLYASRAPPAPLDRGSRAPLLWRSAFWAPRSVLAIKLSLPSSPPAPRPPADLP